jgi:hypothetical protein
MKCPHCGEALPSALCPECGEETPEKSRYCCGCGRPVKAEDMKVVKEMKSGEDSFSERVLCSDGNCIGIINEKGVCNICGKPFAGQTG